MAIYCAYDDVADNPLKFKLDEAAVCPRVHEECGVRGRPPCFKRHIQKVPLKSLRPPTCTLTEEAVDGSPTVRERHMFSLSRDALDKALSAVVADEAKFPPSVLY